jgi:hypothetical protein
VLRILLFPQILEKASAEAAAERGVDDVQLRQVRIVAGGSVAQDHDIGLHRPGAIHEVNGDTLELRHLR